MPGTVLWEDFVDDIYSRWESATNSELVVFHVPKQTLITIKQGYSCTIFNSDKNSLKKKENNTLNTYLLSANAVMTKKQEISNFLYYRGKRIFILDSTKKRIPNLHPDILILTQSTKVNLDRILKELQPQIVVADGSNYKNIQLSWKKSCAKQKIPFHMTREKGYYSIK